MKELFPLRTFHQDAVLKRLAELYDNDVDLDSRIKDLPTPGVADSGKVIKVGADGKYELASNPVDPSDLQGEDIAPKDVNATGNITGPSIIETMTGYSAGVPTPTGFTFEKIYYGVCKNGNKLTFVFALNVTKTDATATDFDIAYVNIPSGVGAKLYPTQIGEQAYQRFLDYKKISLVNQSRNIIQENGYIYKNSNTSLSVSIATSSNMVVNEKYYLRYEATFLLSDDIVPQE